MNLNSYEKGFERFNEELDRELYLFFSGQKEELEVSPVYQRHADLFSERAVENLLGAWNRTGGQRERLLACGATCGHLEDLTKGLDEEYLNRLNKLTVSWDDQDLPFQEAAAQIVKESDWQRRHQLADLVVQTRFSLNHLKVESLEILLEAADRLGFRDVVMMVDGLKALNLSKFSPLMKETARVLRPRYLELLEHYLGELGEPFEERDQVDLGFLRKAPQFDRFFPKKEMISIFGRTLLGMGIDHTAIPGFTIDIEERPNKRPRAFMVSPRIPDEAILCLKPTGGRDDYEALFHEGGHGLGFVHTASSLPFSFRGLGDVAITEAHAFWLGGLVDNPLWAREFLWMNKSEAREYIRVCQLIVLGFVARYTAKLLYEQELYVNPEDAQHRYKEILEEVTSLKYRSTNYLHDVDPFFYVVGYLKAWVLQYQFYRVLEDRFGSRWFTDPRAGAFMRGIWVLGMKLTPEELAEYLGFEGLDTEPMISYLLS